MVILQPESEVKVKTVKQQALITKLLQSSYFSKAEFCELMRRNRNQIVTSYDASVLISYLISVLRFRKKFLSSKHKAHLKCDYCSDRKYLTRYYVPTYNAQKILCMKCEDDEAEAQQEQAKLADKNLQRLKEQGVSVNEGVEASADLHRKYDYPGGDVDMKIDANKAAQDNELETEIANGNISAEEFNALPQNKPLGLQ